MEHRPHLPYVLIIGDSISIGYTRPVKISLQDTCNVLRPRANCGDTNKGIANLESWVGSRTWDLIHFNFGLHDLCYRHPDSKAYGNRDKINGTLAVAPDVYEKNLEQLTHRLAESTRSLVWASTSLVPAGEIGRHQGDEVRYNALASRVMQKHNIPVNDIHALTSTFPPNLFAGPDDIHYTVEGYNKIATVVSAGIKKQLLNHSL